MTKRPPKTPAKKTTPKPDKPDYRTKTAIPDPRNTDPTIPAADPKDEEFCKLVSQSVSGTKAYQIAVNPKSPNVSAASRASYLQPISLIAESQAYIK